VTATQRRALLVAAVATLALAAPLLGRAVAVPFAVVAACSALGARHADGRDGLPRGTLRAVTAFALAATVLALLTVRSGGLSRPAFAAALAVPAFGALGRAAVRPRASNGVLPTAAAVALGGLAGVAAQVAIRAVAAPALPTTVGTGAIFLAASAALVVGALSVDQPAPGDPAVVLSIGLLLWFLSAVAHSVPMVELGRALAVVVALAALSYRLGAANRTGMLTGAFIALQALVLGDPGANWFVPLVWFFAIGGVSTQFRYEQKQETGVAEDDGGARGASNVLGNAGVALLAIFGFAAATAFASRLAALDGLPVDPATVLLWAYLGSLATALGDTLASEIGGVFDDPRLITTLEPVAPGTDGAVTWQGEAAGLAGAASVAVLGWLLFPITPAIAAAVVLGGVAGMTADSLFGVTLEHRVIGNHGVNFAATLVGAGVAGATGLLLAL
jgi:uncharacterized protein (TIGR00297 family)